MGDTFERSDRVDGRHDEGGHVFWTLNGLLHRADGPGIQWHKGATWWYLNGQLYPFEEWLSANTEISEEHKVMIKLEYG